MTTCQHTTTITSHERPFTSSVTAGGGNKAEANYEPRAHGCIVYDEICTTCGASRPVAENQGWLERGPWTASAETLRARAESRLQRLTAAQSQSLRIDFAGWIGYLRVDAGGVVTPLVEVHGGGLTRTASDDEREALLASAPDGWLIGLGAWPQVADAEREVARLAAIQRAISRRDWSALTAGG